jgi:NADPH-dependent 2,4-dienoyl-CoA reductase/sulfur reductase-like enzyme
MTPYFVDVAIIGGGPAGLAAAIKAKEAGAERVTIVERSEAPGGLLEQCVHNGFGLVYFREDLTGPEFAQRFVEKAVDLDVDMELETMVLSITPERLIRACNKKGMFALQAKTIVLAMGCRERTREAIMIPGTRPAGIFTAGTAQRYVNVEGFIPGRQIVILGSGDVGMIMARRLTLEGAEIKAVVEVLPYAGGLIRNEVQCLVDFDIPVFLGHTITEITGPQRVEAVTIAKVDGNLNPVPGTERVIPCDTLLVSVGLIPENELSRAAGVRLNPLTGGPFVDENRQTNISGIFAAGNVTHVHDMVDNVVVEGELAGSCAAEFASGQAKIRPTMNLRTGKNIRYVVPETVTGDKDVVLYMRVKEPAERVSIKVGNILQKSLRFVKPSEMIQIEVSSKEWRKIDRSTCELEIGCETRRPKE